MLEGRNLSKVYGLGAASVRALDNASLSIAPGDFLIICGRSGSGKSTLLHLLGGLDTPTSGDVFFQGSSIFNFTEKQLTDWRRETIGYMFQEPCLVPHLSALDNIALPLKYRGWPVKKRLSTAKDILEKVGLKERVNNRPHELSGGEAQRVALARALIAEAGFVLADEPTGELDSQTASSLGQLLLDINLQNKVSFVVVTHDPVLIELGTKVIELSDGKIAANSLP